MCRHFSPVWGIQRHNATTALPHVVIIYILDIVNTLTLISYSNINYNVIFYTLFKGVFCVTKTLCDLRQAICFVYLFVCHREGTM